MPDKSLKIATYNIHMGKNSAAITRNILYMAENGVMLFCLQEVRGVGRYKLKVEDLLKQLGPTWAAECLLSEKDNFDYGLCFIWDTNYLKPGKVSRVTLPKIPKVRLWQTPYYVVKKMPKTPSLRGSLVATFRFGDKEFRIANIHLDWKGGILHRLRQIEYLAKYLNSQGHAPYEILIGDFNTVWFSARRQVRAIKSVLTNKFEPVLFKFGYTYLARWHLDHIFVRGVKVTDCQILKLKGSDHYPVVSTISWKD